MSNFHTDVETLSYQLLVQFRELFTHSPAEAVLRYGIGLKEGSCIAHLSHDEMKRLAASGKLVFTVKLPDKVLS